MNTYTDKNTHIHICVGVTRTHTPGKTENRDQVGLLRSNMLPLSFGRLFFSTTLDLPAAPQAPPKTPPHTREIYTHVLPYLASNGRYLGKQPEIRICRVCRALKSPAGCLDFAAKCGRKMLIADNRLSFSSLSSLFYLSSFIFLFLLNMLKICQRFSDSCKHTLLLKVWISTEIHNLICYKCLIKSLLLKLFQT